VVTKTTHDPVARRYNTAPATEATQTYAAQRAAADPAKRDKAVRLVGAGLILGTITPDEIIAAAQNIARTAAAPTADRLARIRALLGTGVAVSPKEAA
jgi:hypothetical protein